MKLGVIIGVGILGLGAVALLYPKIKSSVADYQADSAKAQAEAAEKIYNAKKKAAVYKTAAVVSGITSIAMDATLPAINMIKKVDKLKLWASIVTPISAINIGNKPARKFGKYIAEKIYASLFTKDVAGGKA